MSPDWSAKEDPVPYAKLDDPQTLNLYQYVRNNPLNAADLDGHNWLTDHLETFGKGVVHGVSNFSKGTLGRMAPAIAETYGAPINGDGRNVMDHPTSLTEQAGMVAGETAAAAATVAVVAGFGEGTTVSTTPVAPLEVESPAVTSVLQTIDAGGFNVTQNPKTPGQDGNVTITSPNEPGVNLNLRSESHPLPGSGGQSVPHVNVEKVTPRTGSTPKQSTNTHITQ